MRIALRSAYATRRGALLAVNGYCMTVGMPPKPSQTFIMTKDSALKLSIVAKPSIHTARARASGVREHRVSGRHRCILRRATCLNIQLQISSVDTLGVSHTSGRLLDTLCVC